MADVPGQLAPSAPSMPPHQQPPTRADTVAQRAWATFRSWPTWLQWPLGVLFLPMLLAVLTLTKPRSDRRSWWALTAALTVVLGSVAVSSADGSGGLARDSAPVDTTSTTERATATTERQSTTTTTPRAPDGGTRAGSGEDLSPAGAAPGPNALDRAAAADQLLAVLATLTVEPEHARSGYDRDLFPHWDDDDHDGCDTRCEILSAQRLPDGSWLSAWDGYSTDDTAELHVDHVVALAEAWDSGADLWSPALRDELADYLPNLAAVSAASNTRKSDKDAGQWFPSRPEANCRWASTVVGVKQHWNLSVDQAEADALGNLLRTCEDYVAPITTTTRAPTPTPIPTPIPTTTAAPLPTGDCTPGYSPCISPGDDVDCEGGGGDGPRHVDGPVAVDQGYGDPYGLDRDGDGVGCE